MLLQDTITADMKTAMRAKDTARLGTVRLLRAAIQRREVDARITLDDAGVVRIVRQLIKQCRDAAAQFEAGGRADLAAKELAGIAVLEAYLPAPLAAAELEAVIADAIAAAGASSIKDLGKVMGIVKSKTQGRADLGAVSAEIRARLSAG